MKLLATFLSALALLIPTAGKAAFNKQVEKALKKSYREVTYLAHSNCYMVMSKSDRYYYGVCNAAGEEVIPANYKKIAFELGENGEIIMFAINPNYKAPSQGNLVYILGKGKIIDFGRNEPQYIAGGYLSSHGKPIYNMAGNIVLNCEQSAVQPIRIGKEIKGYRVSNRTMINKAATDELIICDPYFNRLFSLEGTGYLWKVDIETSAGSSILWKCTKNMGGNEKLTLLYDADGTPINEALEENNKPILAVETAPQPATAYKTPGPNMESSQVKPITAQTAVTVKRNGSDVDFNPPLTTNVADKTFAVIISNENYSEVNSVQYALHDGEVLSQYFEKTLGIPNSNIKYTPDATLNNMRKQINWLKQIAEAFGQEAKIIFYYSGHGIPDEQSKNAYLMPVDGYHSDMSTNLSINHLYDELSSLNVAQVTVLLDACFSGSQRGDNMLVAARGVKIKSRANAPKGKMIVFSAAQGDETAYPLDDKEHGMFTYFLLKKLRESGDKVTLGELSEYITTEVKRASLLHTGKIQTPSTSVSIEIEPEWRNRLL
ncbi:MAG: caspase family protein [Muribaculaceae bacterium]|nr:caspase family protein [Muribaculaceae bacterium]